MTLKEGITINSHFQNSINLSLDLNHMEKVEDYIPTRSSLAILEKYLDYVTGKHREFSTILIGPYGKGKSHLLLVLLALLRPLPQSSKTLEGLLEKITMIHPLLAQKIKNFRKENRKFLPVILEHIQEDLNRSFLLALHEALVREGLENLAPVTYFSEAVSVIQRWKENYPATYEEFNRILKEEGQKTERLIRGLKQYEQESYLLFTKIYPRLTAGSQFSPMINMSAMAIYQSVNESLCKDYGYTGTFLVFDEFSKYMENQQPETVSGDMKVLQEMCELASHSDQTQLHLVFVAHKSIKEYALALPQSVLHSFQGVEGRLTEIYFLTSAKNNYELIAHAIKKKAGLYEEYFKNQKEEVKFAEEYYQTAGFSYAFGKEDFQKILVKGCFPLTPLAAYFLISISEKVAQNERTLFTFLSKEEPYSLPWIVKDRKEERLIGLPELYDYFSILFQKDMGNVIIHEEWLKADYALSQTKEEQEKQIIKTLALVRMLNRPEEVNGEDMVLRLGAFLSMEEYLKARNNLLKKQILCFRMKTASYDFKNNIGVDLEQEIRKLAFTRFSGISVTELLQKYSGMDYEIPKQYNQKYAITRYFRYQFISYKSFLQVSKSEYLFQEKFADGKILLLVSEESQLTEEQEAGLKEGQDWILEEKRNIQEKLTELNDSRIAVIFSSLHFKEKETLLRLCAIETLLHEESFLEENRVLKEELMLSREDALYQLNQHLEKLYELEKGNSFLILTEGKGCKVYQSLTSVAYNRLLSTLLERYYQNTPKINQELINRNQLTFPIKKARDQIVEALLNQKDLTEFKTKTSPEATIFRATLWHTGLLKQGEKVDSQIWGIVERINCFIKNAKERKSSFAELYESLQGKGIGMRRGPIPIYLAYCFSQFQGVMVIYRKNKEMELTAETLAQINEAPQDYELWTEEGNAAQAEYQEKLKELFKDFISKKTAYEEDNRKITEAMIRWLRSLPPYTLTFTEPVIEIEDKERKELFAFRKLLMRQELNPWETLFVRIPEICGMIKWQMEKKEEKESIDLNCFHPIIQKVAGWKKELEGHIDQVKRTAVKRVKQIFDCKETDNLAQGLKLWRQKQGQQAEQTVYQTSTNHFLNYIRELSTYNEEEILSEISKILLDLFVEDWNDNSFLIFLTVLQQTKDEIEKKEKKKDGKEGFHRIMLEDEKGQIIEKWCAKVEENQNNYVFQNALTDLLEEVGESVELEQKVAILADTLKGLLL